MRGLFYSGKVRPTLTPQHAAGVFLFSTAYYAIIEARLDMPISTFCLLISAS